MRRFAAVVGSLLLLASAPAYAGAVAALREFLGQTKTARGEFTQQVTRGGAQAAPRSSGTFQFERPGRFRWTYLEPYEQVLVADGERLFLYDKDLNQLTVRKVAAALPASPASILFGGNEFERDFVVADAGTRDGIEWLTAVPRAKESQFERIEIGFRDGVPAAMVLADSFGQVSRLTFSRFERNAKIDAQLFRFVPPAGADVLEER
ncbi:MAG: outer membrane lipoprotein chaperone LolA [Burkholderiales bacterium]|jgi:outer membrane lipoprotein carrier protein|nr:outer membrane lipoprotein chaperone LolA [Burkholderiales bacterium]